EFAEEDKKVKEKIDACTALETYMYNMKNQVSDKDKLADKLEGDEKEKIEAATKEALEWLDENQSAQKEETGGAPGGGGADSTEDDDEHDEL
ncbi:luminal binding protein 5, partial [Tanacetum coccineum]